MSSAKINCCVAGLKGLRFVTSLLQSGFRIDALTTYPQKDDRSKSFDALVKLATDHAIELRQTRHPKFDPDSLAFVVGWQYLMTETNDSTVVFHDSLLPRFRGFAPTVTALVQGEPKIGVTALRPTSEVDQGPIFAQAAVDVVYPIKIARALELQAELMASLAMEIADKWSRGMLVAQPQLEGEASYSLWRDEADYEIDWSMDAARIHRFIDAVGHPYAGAKTLVGGKLSIRVHEATVLPELRFEIRDVGKIWKLDDGRPIVVCGTGMLRLDRFTLEDGSEYCFDRLRFRLGGSL